MKNKFTKKILITGSAGFIGKNLTKALIKNGYRNLTLLDLQQKVFVDKGMRGIKGSFSDTALMDEILPGHDVVFHLAAIVGVYKALREKGALRRINLESTKQFIDLAVRHKVQKIVFSSSSEVYGNNKKIPFREDAVLNPISEYAQYKIAIENYLAALARSRKISATVVRFFNVYGPGQRTDFVMNKFIECARNGTDLSVNWDGRQTRCFTFVEDAVRGLMLAMGYSRKSFNVFNIGNSEETSILDLARIVIEMTGSKSSDIVISNKNKLDRYDVLRRVPYLVHSKNELKYAPSVTLERGLRKIIDEKK